MPQQLFRSKWTSLAFSTAVLVLLGGVAVRAQNGSGYYASLPADQAAQAQFAAGTGDPSQDPPQRVARIAVLNGPASFEPAAQTGFSAAEINFPMTSGDRLYTGAGALAEVQAGQISARLGENTDFTVQTMTDGVAQFGLAGGSLRLRVFGFEPGAQIEVDTPNAAVRIPVAGDVRIDVDERTGESFVAVLNGQANIEGANFAQTIGAGTALALRGTDALQAERVQAQGQDALDAFALERDGAYERAYAELDTYVSPDTVGSADLAQYGDWQQDANNGPVWYPHGVAADWEPYRVGHWAYVGPWGWTWVDSEPWGFAPFHYGRWARFGPRWGWIPGPRPVRPVWAPALVVFVGGANFTGWFPLGPREVFTPWYRTSPVYVNRVNVTNIWSRDVANVRRVYAMREPFAGYNGAPASRSFAYRDRAVAVPPAVFAGGRPVGANRLNVDPRQMGAAPVLGRPAVPPARDINARGPARVQPGSAGGPAFYRGAGRPGAQTGTLPARENGMVGSPRPGAGATPAQGGEWNGGRGWTGRNGGAQQPAAPGSPQQPGRQQPSAGQPGQSAPTQVMPMPNPRRGSGSLPAETVPPGRTQTPDRPQGAPGQPTQTFPTPNPRRGAGMAPAEPQQRVQPEQQRVQPEPPRVQPEPPHVQPQPRPQQPAQRSEPGARPQPQPQSRPQPAAKPHPAT